uniref:Uncharacterized protein n=1 Tax=viral metagenome TaxID=1070528 RepID=A0A6M3XPJ8_9ZZZZ
MCLSTIDKKTKNWKVGYKVFDKYKNKLYPLYYNTSRPFKVNEWIKNPLKITIYLFKVSDTFFERYETGFHFYRYKEDAEKFIYSNRVVRKVKVRKLTATGTQDGYKVGVAQEMLILKEE